MEPSATVTTRRRGHVRSRRRACRETGDVLVIASACSGSSAAAGMGVVFAANDLQMQGEPSLAIKLLNEECATSRSPPRRSSASAAKCACWRTMPSSGYSSSTAAGDLTFITMELLDGESLDVVIKRFPQGLPWEDAWPIIRATGDALGYAHRQTPPFVHSDFKPSNVFVTRTNRVKVLDFGVARAARTPRW